MWLRIDRKLGSGGVKCEHVGISDRNYMELPYCIIVDNQQYGNDETVQQTDTVFLTISFTLSCTVIHMYTLCYTPFTI